MSDYREESEKAKQIKRGVTEQREKVISKRKKKRFKLTCVFNVRNIIPARRICIGNYTTMKAAKEARQRHENKPYYSEFEIEEI